MLAKNRLHVAIAGALALGAGSAFAGSFTAEGIQAPMPPQLVPDSTLPDKHEVHSSSQALINGFVEATGFTPLLRSGDQLPALVGTEPSASETERFGKLYMADGTALVDENGGGCLDFDNPDASCDDAISNSNDFNSFIEAGGNLYLVSHFETRPGAMYLTLLDQDTEGNLTPEATRLIDFTGVYGGWVHCAGTKTPWGSHLGSEEYEPDARTWVDATKPISGYNAAMAAYYDATGWEFRNNNPSGTDLTVASENMNPYRYGYPVEVKVEADGSTEVIKHFAMGRTANELSYVMPDNKTVYITDDGTNTMLVMYVAQDADGNDLPYGDLSQGRLYAGIWNQITDTTDSVTGAPLGGRAWLSWIDLGHATSDQIAAVIDDAYDDQAGRWEVQFDDMFNYADPNPDGTCPGGLTSVNSGHGRPYQECLAIKTDVVGENIISRLETRRYAALKGATTELKKVEGASYDPSRRVLYMAISDITDGMLNDTDSAEDIGGNNHIRVAENRCGAIYELRMSSRGRDTDGNRINSRYVARTMTGILAGKPVDGVVDPNDPDGEDMVNQCSLDSIGNPDNITFLPGYNLLIIGEDAGNSVHQIDMVWAYDMRSKELTRIQSTPFGSETTSVYWYPNLNGWGYLMSVVQHPYGESDGEELANAPEGEAGKFGYVGYFKFPALD